MIRKPCNIALLCDRALNLWNMTIIWPGSEKQVYKVSTCKMSTQDFAFSLITFHITHCNPMPQQCRFYCQLMCPTQKVLSETEVLCRGFKGDVWVLFLERGCLLRRVIGKLSYSRSWFPVIHCKLTHTQKRELTDMSFFMIYSLSVTQLNCLLPKFGTE